MTRSAPVTPAGQPALDGLSPRASRGSGLHTADATHVVVPASASCLAAPGPVTSLPPPQDAALVASILRDHPRWSAFWDKAYGVWRVAEDDPGSGLYAESSDAATVIRYIQAHA